MHLYTQTTHTYTQHTCAWSQQASKTCALGALDKANPQIFTRYGAVTRYLFKSSPRGFKMFEKHCKLMALILNLLVSISSTIPNCCTAQNRLSIPYLNRIVYSLFVLSPLGEVNSTLRWIRRLFVLLASMCPHISVQLHLVLQFKWNSQRKHVFQSIPNCLVEHW